MLYWNLATKEFSMEKTTSGWINGLIGVTFFAGSLPATRVAVADSDPVFLTCARATLATLPGLALHPAVPFGITRVRMWTCAAIR